MAFKRIKWLLIYYVSRTLPPHRKHTKHHRKQPEVAQYKHFLICLNVVEPDMEQQTGSKSGKGVHQGCILSPCLFNLYAEYIMRNAWLDEAQAGIKIAARNINNLRYADDTTFRAESEELKSLLMKVKEEIKKVNFKLNIQKMKIMASGPITSWQIDGKQWKQWQTLFWGAPKSLQWWLQPGN